jgi:hypothetical protein
MVVVSMSAKIKLILGVAGFVVLGLGVFSLTTQKALAAACTLPATDLGTVTQTVSIPADGTYRVWSRIMAPDTTNNSYKLEIDGNTCFTVGDSAITANTWTWVDYQSATSTNKINATLTAGSHTIKMIGNEAGVKLDRVIFTADTTCVPTGTGDNCASPPDTTPPVVSITAPANNANVSGSVTVAVNATDDTAVSKVELYVDGALANTDTTSPYSFTLNTASLSVGVHALSAKAYDAANNVTTSSTVTINVQDVTNPTVSVTAPANGATVQGTVALTATASDNVGVAKVEFYVDGTLKITDTSAPFSGSLDTTTLTNASHSITAKAYDAANNSTTSAAVSVTVNNVVTPPPDPTPPTVSISSPASGTTISGNAYAVAATAADNVGVTKVEFYVDGTLKNTDTSAPFSFNLDTTTLTNAAHSFSAKAYDAANNVGTSATVNATVANTAFIPEDINQDGHVNILDVSLLINNYGKSGTGLGRTDINGDGTVNILDVSLLIAKYGL